MYAIPFNSPRRRSEPDLTADDLLAWVSKDPEWPFYAHSTLKAIRSREKPSGRCEHYPATIHADAVTYLRAQNLRQAIADAYLTDRQHDVFCARVRGETWRSISSRFGHTKQCAVAIFRAAHRKVHRAIRISPLRGLAQVYKQEVTRYVPSRIGRR